MGTRKNLGFGVAISINSNFGEVFSNGFITSV